VIVSINPLYRCNFRCSNCYLTDVQLKSKTVLKLGDLKKRLSEMPDIAGVEVYGGEVTLLDPNYISALKKEIRLVYGGPIAVTTNLYRTPEWLLDPDITVNVSFDFEHRPHHETVLNNILMFPKPVNLIILATPEVMAGNITQQMLLVKSMGNVESIEIKPYSANQANTHSKTNEAFVEYMKYWLTNFKDDRLYNYELLDMATQGTRNAFSDDHVYITPFGKFGVLEFDAEDREYFLALDSFSDYVTWTAREKRELLSTECQRCEFLGRCLTEHYRRNEGQEGECSGYKSLMQWWLERTS